MCALTLTVLAVVGAVAAFFERLRLRRVERDRLGRLPMTGGQFLRACGLADDTPAARTALAVRSAVSRLSSVPVEQVMPDDYIWRDLIRIESWDSLYGWAGVAELVDAVELHEPLRADAADAY